MQSFNAHVLPACRECGQPSPNGDPCEQCAEVERILSMSDEEVIATSSAADLAWARGWKEGFTIGRFAASVDTHPQGGDATQIAAPFMSGAVPCADTADAQITPGDSNG